jgi:hypothetical protein
MRKTSTIMALAIATILTAYTGALTMSNQAFAEKDVFPGGGLQSSQPGQEAQHDVGQVLGGIHTTIHNILGGSTTRDHGDHGDLLGCGNPWDPC